MQSVRFVFWVTWIGCQIATAQPPARVSSANPVLVRRIAPEYSDAARAAGLEGTVTLYLEVTPEGRPENVKVLQGLGLGLNEKAVEAVQHWQFEPGMVNGKAATIAQAAEVEFRLSEGGPWRIRRAVYRFSAEDNKRFPEIVKPAIAQYQAPEACQGDGRALVGVAIDKSGKPGSIHLAEGEMDAVGAAAVKAVASWKFLPAEGNGKPIESHAEIEFTCGAGAPPPVRHTPPPPDRPATGVTPPTVIRQVQPEYSEAARKAKFSGQVTVAVVVSASGTVSDAHIFQMLGMGLDEKALEAVKQWRFYPGMKDGKPVAVQAQVEMNFRLL